MSPFKNFLYTALCCGTLMSPFKNFLHNALCCGTLSHLLLYWHMNNSTNCMQRSCIFRHAQTGPGLPVAEFLELLHKILLPLILYGCSKLFLSLREEYLLQIFVKKNVLQKISGLQEYQVNTEWKKLCNISSIMMTVMICTLLLTLSW
jgi:hypothetical protein